MNVRESDSWALLRPALSGLDPQRLEAWNKLGVPDVNFIFGWIELKHMAAWPMRESTLISIRHFRPEQRAWLTRRCKANRDHRQPIGAWFLLHISDVNEMVLLAGDVAAALVGKATRAQIYEASPLRGSVDHVISKIVSVIGIV